MSWFSAAVFGLYIAAFYMIALPTHQVGHWNAYLPGLHDKNYLVSVAAMALRLAARGVILLLGPIQLIDARRRRWPAFHRWAGRIYVTTSAVAGAGGLAFILGNGTIGGTVMNIGFGIYGTLMALAAFQTYRHAVKREFGLHRAWGIRLFALAIGS